MDNLAEPSISVKNVLDEVKSAFDQPVMNNVHRSDYGEAMVALALRKGGWHRTEAWDQWDLENESGCKLEVKHAAAAQRWQSGNGRRYPRFDIAPRTVRYEKDGRRESRKGRNAHVYVFAWHGAPRDTADQRKPASWEFYVAKASELPDQKTIALSRIRALFRSCDITTLSSVLDEVSESAVSRTKVACPACPELVVTSVGS